MQGEYHWHRHENDDEFFFVLEGHFALTWRSDQSIFNHEKASSYLEALSIAPALRIEPSF
jgi:uncharacterized cupin superfamily protein